MPSESAFYSCSPTHGFHWKMDFAPAAFSPPASAGHRQASSPRGAPEIPRKLSLCPSTSPPRSPTFCPGEKSASKELGGWGERSLLGESLRILLAEYGAACVFDLWEAGKCQPDQSGFRDGPASWKQRREFMVNGFHGSKEGVRSKGCLLGFCLSGVPPPPGHGGDTNDLGRESLQRVMFVGFIPECGSVFPRAAW